MLLSAIVLLAAALAPAARAADAIYWSNVSSVSGGISFADLDGSAAGDLETVGASVKEPGGIAIDSAAGRIYWADATGNTISFANLDGSGGGGDLNTTGATVATPVGVAIDPAAGRIYWANAGAAKISYANLNGSGGGDLGTTGATVNAAIGVAIDPAAGRIYWANYFGNKISYANLDGSGGGGDLITAGATVAGPRGVAIDPAAGRIYWADFSADKISYANLNGSGGGDLATTGATVSEPAGVAVDPAAGRIYWGNAGTDKVSFANLNGSGGADLATLGARVENAGFPALLKAPAGAGVPSVTGGSAAGSELSCSQGSWAPDLLASFVYRAPQSFTYSWSRNGEAIAGADQSSYTASIGGEYRCSVSAANVAGSAAQTSAAHGVSTTAASPGGGEAKKVGFGARPLVTLKLGAGRIAAAGPLPVRIVNGNAFTVSGTLVGQAAGKVPAHKRARAGRVGLKARSFAVAAHATKTVKLTLPRTLRRLLERTHKLSLVLTATVKDPAGQVRSVKKTVTPRLKTKTTRRH